MAKRDAIRTINNGHFLDNEQKKTLRKLVDIMYADGIGVVIVSNDDGNVITEGTDGGAFYNGGE
jgi:hypothetical protein